MSKKLVGVELDAEDLKIFIGMHMQVNLLVAALNDGNLESFEEAQETLINLQNDAEKIKQDFIVDAPQ